MLQRSDRHETCLGGDCALLLSHDADVDRSANRKEKAAVFFGRGTNQASAIEFAAALCQSLKLSAEWLNWFGEASPVRLRRLSRLWYRAVAGVSPGAAPATLKSLLQEIGESRLVITDTYHMAVNAWAMGVRISGLPS